MHGSLNLDVVSLVIRLIVFCCHLHWVTHDSRISPFWFALYKLHNFLVNMSFVYTIGVCNKMVLTLDQCTAPLSLPTLEFLGRSVGRSNKLLCIDFTSIWPFSPIRLSSNLLLQMTFYRVNLKEMKGLPLCCLAWGSVMWCNYRCAFLGSRPMWY